VHAGAAAHLEALARVLLEPVEHRAAWDPAVKQADLYAAPAKLAEDVKYRSSTIAANRQPVVNRRWNLQVFQIGCGNEQSVPAKPQRLTEHRAQVLFIQNQLEHTGYIGQPARTAPMSQTVPPVAAVRGSRGIALSTPACRVPENPATASERCRRCLQVLRFLLF